MKQDAKIIKRTRGNGSVVYLVRLHTIHDNSEQYFSFVGGGCGPNEYEDLEVARKVALEQTFLDTIEE